MVDIQLTSPELESSSMSFTTGPQQSEVRELVTFPLKELPLELQVRIWEHVVSDSEPRVVEISYLQARKGNYTSPTGAPQLFHLCSASRNVALQRYHPLMLGSWFTGTYVNWDVDIIYFTDALHLGEKGLSDTYWKANGQSLVENCKRIALCTEALPRLDLMYSRLSNASVHTRLRDRFAPLHFQALQEIIEFLSVPEGEGEIRFETVDRYAESWYSEPDSPLAKAQQRLRRAEGVFASVGKVIQTSIATTSRGQERLLTKDFS